MNLHWAMSMLWLKQNNSWIEQEKTKTIQFWFSLLSWWVAANIDWKEITGAQLWVGPIPTVFWPICQISIYCKPLHVNITKSTKKTRSKAPRSVLFLNWVTHKRAGCALEIRDRNSVLSAVLSQLSKNKTLPDMFPKHMACSGTTQLLVQVRQDPVPSSRTKTFCCWSVGSLNILWSYWWS